MKQLTKLRTRRLHDEPNNKKGGILFWINLQNRTISFGCLIN